MDKENIQKSPTVKTSIKGKKIKNDLIQDFKNENPTKDVGKLPAIKIYNRFPKIRYPTRQKNINNQLSKWVSQKPEIK